LRSALVSIPFLQSVLTKRTTAFAILFLPVCLLITLFLYYGDKNYFSIQLDDIPAEGYLVAHFHDEIYVIVKVPVALSSIPQNNISNTSSNRVRVFSLSMQKGYLMLPSKKQQNYQVPCMQFEYITQLFMHDDNEVSGGFKCSYSISPAWERNLVYDLQGNNLKPSMRSLYVPQHYVIDGELRVGVSQ
jgi:hypothetical protein